MEEGSVRLSFFILKFFANLALLFSKSDILNPVLRLANSSSVSKKKTSN